MDPHLLILLLCLGLLLLAARATRRILYRACAPRSLALRRTSWRDLCLLRSDRLSAWPALEAAFEVSRLEWLAIHGDPPIAQRPEVRHPTRLRVPAVLVDHSQLCLQDLADVERHNVVWQSFSSFNALFFHGQLQVDDIRFRASVPGSLDAAQGAEAAVRYEFSGDFTSATLWIEFIWPCCKSWTLMRTVSVLLHEMVHVWHDSSWTRRSVDRPQNLVQLDLIPRGENGDQIQVVLKKFDQHSTSHSATFLRMCADLNQMCQDEDLPFFPNIFTESWVLLVSDDLGEFGAFCAGQQPQGDFGHRWMDLLKRDGHFKGNLLGDLQELGISLLDAIAAKKLLNSVHIQQALHFGYDRLQSWRRFIAQACMQRVASSRSTSDFDVIIRGDYVVARQAVLAQLAARGGFDASIVASAWTAWKQALSILVVTLPQLHYEAAGMGIEEIRVVPVCGLCSCLALVIFTCVALPMSIKSMEQGRNSVQLQWMTQSILDEAPT
eukprot:s2804_g2.t2